MARKRQGRRAKGTGSYCYDEKNKRHVWKITHNGRRYQVTDQDEGRAKTRFETLRRRVLGNMDIEGGKQLLNTYLPHYINTEVAPQFKRSTAHDNHNRADYYILPTLGEYRLCDLHRRIIVAWVNAMLETKSKRGKLWSLDSIKQARSLLSRCLDAAVLEGYIDFNPAAGVKVPRRRQGDELRIDETTIANRAFTLDQMASFLNEVKRTDKQHGLFVYYLLISELGHRRGEALGLRRKDIDFEINTLSIKQQVIRLDSEILITTPKTPRSKRDLPVSDELMTALRAQCLKVGAGRPEDLIFPGKEGKPRNPNSVTQHFRRVCTRLGFGGFTLHSLRKYAITDLRRHGADAEVTAAMAGHGVNVMASVYSDPQMDRMRDALNKKKKAE